MGSFVTIRGCARHVFREFIMANTQITEELLKEKGFSNKIIDGHTVFSNGRYGLMHLHAWIPLNVTDFSVPVMSNAYINTWEEFEKLIEESKSK